MKEALKLALEALETIVDAIYINSEQEADAVYKVNDAITAIKAALAQPTSGDYAHGYVEGFNDACMPKPAQQEPVAWLQFRDNEPPVVAPRDLGTPVFLGIRGGLAHDAQSKEQL